MVRMIVVLAAGTALAGCAVRPAPPVAAAPVVVEAAPEAPVAAAPKAAIGSFGVDTAGMDPTVKPGDDFYNFVNGKWARTTAIPADKSNYGAFHVLQDQSEQRVRELLDAARDDPDSKIGIAYASFLDEAAVEAAGLAPIQPWLSRIRALASRSGYAALQAEAARNGVTGLFASGVGQDDRHSDTYVVGLSQAGLGMPDRDMYLLNEPNLVALRAAYLGHLEKVLTLAGESNAAARAKAILSFETAIARASWTREDSSDATKTYNKMTVAQLARLAPGFDWASFLRERGMRVDDLVVAQPSAFTAIARLARKAPLAVLKDQLIVQSMDTFSDVLPKAVSDEAFAFYGNKLNGTPENQPRWKRAVAFATNTLTDDISKIYVAKYFPPESKAAMNELVANLIAAMGRRIDGLTWMAPETKGKAKAKLAAFKSRVGYPDQWHDYSALMMTRGDLFGNALRANQWADQWNVGKLGHPVYRWEWGLDPMTVNAQANFQLVAITFPAAILQPPFFDPNADPAVNYGGIGAVIGHEMSHHFDDQGSKYDASGSLADWWTPSDIANFKRLSQNLVKQYDGYEVFPGAHVKGEFTLGENIGDLAGLQTAYDAYHASLGGREAPVIDGLTGDQRFYLGWAQVWRRNYREANLRQRLLTDPHAPNPYRADIVRNFDPWYRAFAVEPGGKLYLAPPERVRIW